MTAAAGEVHGSRQYWAEIERGYGESPVHAALGLSLEIADSGEAVIIYKGVREAQNRRGNLSGGAIAQMVDSAIVQSCRAMLTHQDKLVTLELKINYVRAGTLGVHVVARGRLDHLGRTTAVGHARVEDMNGKLVALGSATVSIQRAPSTTA
jgi:uncharacterized protein (TIGR00369 family)